MHMSSHFTASLALLLIAAIMYLVALATTSWSSSGEELTFGIWEFCFWDIEDEKKKWKCLTSKADFTMAAQAFSILAVMCYAVAFLLYLAYIIFPTLSKSRPITMGLCLLGFCVVCLQIMTTIVYGVKVGDYFRKVEIRYFTHQLKESLMISWSFAFAIVSTLMATASGICTFLELRNITLEDLV
ncbi:uncharacterized protein LOC121375730 [Gigantopelta aegis]|uniref:uncharacterized protein LOC121375730 n=1 Tax=Gigantopelta aegis TaxID=1735272 RepID=UPI001B8875CA|nr:uncharacterized protein LOC121375730 [Gigantopelta aegis]